MNIESDHFKTLEELIDTVKMWVKIEEEFYDRWFGLNEMNILVKEIEKLNKCIDEALEIIIKDWNDKCTIPIHAVVDTGDDIRIKLYYQLFLKGADKVGGDYTSAVELKHVKKEIERLNKENEKLKKGLNKLLQLNNYMVNFSSKKVIDKLIVKQRDLIYELLEGRPRGIMHGSKGVDKE